MTEREPGSRREPMSTRLAAMSEDELGIALAGSASHAGFPPTPPIAQLVRARIERDDAAARAGGADRAVPRPASALLRGQRLGWPRLPLRRSTVIALLAVVALVAVVGAAILGVPGIRLIFVGATPSDGPPASSPATSPATPSATVPAGERLRLGARSTLDEATALVDFDVSTPADPVLGPPDEVYVEEIPPTHQVSLVWRPRPGLPETSASGVGLLLMQFAGVLVPDQYEKLLHESTRVVEVTVNGGHGFWIEGGSHFFVEVADPTEWRDERIRLAGNTLVWQEGDVTFRLEADVDLERASEIAGTLAP